MGEWTDDSTYTLTVLNGTEYLKPGIVDDGYSYGDFTHDAQGLTPLVDTRTRVALRRGIVIQSRDCEAKYRNTPHCVAKTGLSDTAEGSLYFGYEAPHLRGDFGRVGGPRIVSFTADDPDNGDDFYGESPLNLDPPNLPDLP